MIALLNSVATPTGPWRTYGAIALSLEPTTGLASFTGYPGGPPVRWSWFTDFPACFNAVFAVCGALRHRNLTGEGQHIDLAMYEVGVSMLGEQLLDYMLNGHIQPRIGNHHPVHAPHNVYRCAGDDAWVTIAVTSDAAWAALCAAIERRTWRRTRASPPPPGARRTRMTSTPRSASIASHDRHDITRHLQAPVWRRARCRRRATCSSTRSSPTAASSSGWTTATVTRKWACAPTPAAPGGWSAHLVSSPGGRQLGEHNTAVLGDLLGVDRDGLEALTAQGVIGETPAEGTPRPDVNPIQERIDQGRWASWDPDFETRLGFANG
ncbi:MAG: CoA transferase [Dehalococcoidia bacterium]